MLVPSSSSVGKKVPLKNIPPMSPYEMLQSMSECVSETQNIFIIPKIPDRVTSTSKHIPRKPPKEIFYRKNLLFITSGSDQINEICYCNCLVKCNINGKKGIAVKKCLSCALYDTTGESFFCSACFTYRYITRQYVSIFLFFILFYFLCFLHRDYVFSYNLILSI